MSKDNVNIDDMQIIRITELAEILNVHKSTLYRWQENGEMPIPKIQVGPGIVGYLKSDLKSYLEESRKESIEKNSYSSINDEKGIKKAIDEAGYHVPTENKVKEWGDLTINERLHIALGRLENKKTGVKGVTKKKLSDIFEIHAPNITTAAKEQKSLKVPLSIFKYLFKITGLPYSDVKLD